MSKMSCVGQTIIFEVALGGKRSLKSNIPCVVFYSSLISAMYKGTISPEFQLKGLGVLPMRSPRHG